jgi:hypothetical protein
MSRFLTLVLLVAGTAFAQAPPSHSQSANGCFNGKGELHKKLENGFSLNIRPSTEDMEAPCWGEILDASGKEIYGNNNFGVRLNEMTGKDIDNDGDPEIVIEAYSGGAHCCWEYGFISLTAPPRTAKIRNTHPFALRDINGRPVLYTNDGAFDYFEAPYAASPRADVFLQLHDAKFHDVGPELVPEYDRRIAEEKRLLPPEKLQAFLASGSDPDWEVKSAVLTVVLEYLYSGREQEAWKVLAEMWPPGDRKRIQPAIVKARAGGLLRQLNGKVEPQDY